MDLLDFLKQNISLSSEQLKVIDEQFKYEGYLKGTIFLRPNNYSKRLIFLEKGLYRSFYYLDEKEITHYFWDENSFNVPIETVLNDSIGIYGWQAIEQCEVRWIDYDDFEVLMISNIELYRLILKYVSEMTVLFSNRAYNLNFKTAEEKLKSVLEEFPNVIHRVPLGDLASFIGITQQTLSVLRGRK